MFNNYVLHCFTIVLLCATSFASVTGVKGDDRDDRKAAAVDTPDAIKRGELVFHGNYCGLGNRAGAEPIDALDLACMHHDACTPTGKVQSCPCNARLAEEASAVARDPTQTAELQSLAVLTAAAATAGKALCIPSAPAAERATGVASLPVRPADAAEAEPLGPMTACVSPARTTRSTPVRICLSSTLTCRSRISKVAMCQISSFTRTSSPSTVTG